MNAGATLGVDVSHDEDACFICFETSPLPIQSGCACRGAAGLAHPGCRVRAAQALVQQKGSVAWWWKCQTCEQHFTSEMRDGLANAWWSQVQLPDSDRLYAAANLACCLSDQGKSAEAEEMECEVHTLLKRAGGGVEGEGQGAAGGCKLSRELLKAADMLACAGNLARTLFDQEKYAEAEEMLREVLAVQKRVLGGEHPDTLAAGGFLAECLVDQEKHAEAEEIQREVLAVQKRVLGDEHPDTLAAAGNVAECLVDQKKYAEAEEMLREVFAVSKRILLGATYPETLKAAGNLAECLTEQDTNLYALAATNLGTCLLHQEKYAEAEEMLREGLAVQKRVLGAEEMLCKGLATQKWVQKRLERHADTVKMLELQEMVCANFFARPESTEQLAPAKSGRVQLGADATATAGSGLQLPMPAVAVASKRRKEKAKKTEEEPEDKDEGERQESPKKKKNKEKK